MLYMIEYALMVVGKAMVLRKMGENPWMALIPLYSEYLMFRHCWDRNLFAAVCVTGLGWTGLMALLNVLPAVEVTKFSLYLVIHTLLMLAGLLFAIGFLIAMVIGLYKLAQHFNHGVGYTVGLIFLPFIFLIILGMGHDEYIENV